MIDVLRILWTYAEMLDNAGLAGWACGSALLLLGVTAWALLNRDDMIQHDDGVLPRGPCEGE